MNIENLLKDGLTLADIENPSEIEKLVAVQQNGLALALIENPSEEVIRAALQQNALALHYTLLFRSTMQNYQKRS